MSSDNNVPTPSGAPAPHHTKLSRSGLLFAFGAYGIWGFFPLFFLTLEPASAFEIVSYRILFSVAVCLVLIAFTRSWRRLWSLMKQRRVMLYLGIAGALIYLNWQIFIIAVVGDQVVESSIGYFINPIFTVILGVTVLREKLRTMQWVAVGVSGIAVIVLTVSYGQLPWISLGLAGTFGLYGLIKKRVGGQVDAISGLTIETMWMVPVATVQLVIVANLVGLTFFGYGVLHTILLMSTGIMTAIPLLMFAAGARRLPLTAIGLIQYSTPIFTFVLGVFILNEPMPPSRWAGVMLIWVALVILTADMLRHQRGMRLARAAENLTAA